MGEGSALERILEKAMGSAGRLGVVATGAGSFTGVPITTPLCRRVGEAIVAILGDCVIDDRRGCACETGDRGGYDGAAGEVYAPL